MIELSERVVVFREAGGILFHDDRRSGCKLVFLRGRIYKVQGVAGLMIEWSLREARFDSEFLFINHLRPPSEFHTRPHRPPRPLSSLPVLPPCHSVPSTTRPLSLGHVCQPRQLTCPSISALFCTGLQHAVARQHFLRQQLPPSHTNSPTSHGTPPRQYPLFPPIQRRQHYQ